MEQDLDLDLGEDNTEEIISRKDKKINSLSEKYKLAEQEKAELAAKEETARKQAEEAQKERDFFKNFNSLSAKYQGAQDFQDAIWERVQKGVDAEEAAIAVLVKEGKFTPPAPQQESPQAAGGSADTSIHDVAEKSPDKMSREELRSVLDELQSKGELKL